MEYGCIGEHLTHSFSAEIHGELASYRYEIQELTPNELGPFLTAADFRGINVTIPYKEKVIPYLTEIDEHAKVIGAVNTIVNRGGKLYGYNTDFYGMSQLIRRIGLSLFGKKTSKKETSAAHIFKDLTMCQRMLCIQSTRWQNYETVCFIPRVFPCVNPFHC